MKTISPAKELSSLQWELNNCRQTVLFLEDSLRHTEESIPTQDPRRDSVDSLIRQITEKDKQLKIIEDMLMHQKVILNSSTEESYKKTNALRKAMNHRLHVHKQDISHAKDYYYQLLRDLKVA